MGLADITKPAHVLMAIAEYDQIGREAFLTKYGFRPSRAYWLMHDGRAYDSKAILGAAHAFARPDLGRLIASDFSGGQSTVQRKLEAMGFEVKTMTTVDGGTLASTAALVTGRVYTRSDLRSLFDITDSTLNTGVFRLNKGRTIWLFVTLKKTSDRVQYEDRLEGDTLYWQGQSSGRTDKLIATHYENGLDLIVFLRSQKYEFPGAGFRCLGSFIYESHSGSRPATFILKRATAVTSLLPSSADTAAFDPNNIDDARQRVQRTIAQRRGQQAFRDLLIEAYDGRCCMSGCSVLDVLEAAHIYPYRGPDTNKVDNGLLLRADLHTLFDCGLLAIEPTTLSILVAPTLRGSEYERLHGRALRLTVRPDMRPSAAALAMHRATAGL